jgi:toxin ParE1/3/4
VIQRRVVYSPEAQDDLLALYVHIADAASPRLALVYLDRVEAWLAGFATASERGTRRDDPRLGLCAVGFERRITAAFLVTDDEVVILRKFHGGQDWGAAMAEGW